MERTAPKVLKKPKLIGNIKEIKEIKTPELTGKIERPTVIGNNDKHEKYVNPITINYVLRPTCLAALRKIKKKDKELQEKFEEVSQKIEKKINDQKLWFPLRKALKNYTKSFGIKIINKNEPIIQFNSTIDRVASLLKKQLNEMKGIKYIETLKLTFKKTTIDADKNQPKIIFETAYFNSKTKTIINENEVNENIQTSNQEILNGIGVWLSEGSGWTVESVNDQCINIIRYKPLKASSYIELPPELRNPAKGLINLQNKDNECSLGGAISDTQTHNKKILRELRIVIKNTSKIGLYQCYLSSGTKTLQKNRNNEQH